MEVGTYIISKFIETEAKMTDSFLDQTWTVILFNTFPDLDPAC